MFSSTIKTAVINSIHCSGLQRLFSMVYGGHTSVILLHRVADGNAPKHPMNRLLQVTPECLESFIIRMKGKGWRFISLDYLLANFDECSERGRNMVFTLDDGYEDNLVNAAPVFEKHDIPFIVYVTNSFPNGTAKLWWLRLEDALIGSDSVEIPLQTGETLKLSGRAFHRSFDILREHYLSLEPSKQENLLEYLAERYPDDSTSNVYGLSWDQIRALSKNNLCTIGAHTSSHCNLRRLSDDAAFDEMSSSKAELERQIGRAVEHFSYPFGTSNEVAAREVDIAKRVGFKSAVTTRVGNLFDEHREHLFSLPRIPLYDGDMKKAVDLYMSGMCNIVKYGFKRAVTL